MLDTRPSILLLLLSPPWWLPCQVGEQCGLSYLLGGWTFHLLTKLNLTSAQPRLQRDPHGGADSQARCFPSHPSLLSFRGIWEKTVLEQVDRQQNNNLCVGSLLSSKWEYGNILRRCVFCHTHLPASLTE